MDFGDQQMLSTGFLFLNPSPKKENRRISEKIKDKSLFFSIDAPPPPRKKKKPQDEMEILILKHFTATPKILFENVTVGKSKVILLKIINPTPDCQNVVFDIFPHDMGFSASIESFDIKSNENEIVKITWTPSEAGSYREVATVHVNPSNLRLRVIFIGSASEKRKLKSTRKYGTSKFQKENDPYSKCDKKMKIKTRTKECLPRRKVPRVIMQQKTNEIVNVDAHTSWSDETVEIVKSIKHEAFVLENQDYISSSCKSVKHETYVLEKQDSISCHFDMQSTSTSIINSCKVENILDEKPFSTTPEYSCLNEEIPETPARRQTFVLPSGSPALWSSLHDGNYNDKAETNVDDLRRATFCKQLSVVVEESSNDSLESSALEERVFLIDSMTDGKYMTTKESNEDLQTENCCTNQISGDVDDLRRATFCKPLTIVREHALSDSLDVTNVENSKFLEDSLNDKCSARSDEENIENRVKTAAVDQPRPALPKNVDLEEAYNDSLEASVMEKDVASTESSPDMKCENIVCGNTDYNRLKLSRKTWEIPTRDDIVCKVAVVATPKIIITESDLNNDRTADYTFLKQCDSIVNLKRCSTGIKCNAPSLAPLSEMMHGRRELFVNHNDMSSQSIRRINSETFVKSAPPSPTEIEDHPVDNLTKSIEETSCEQNVDGEVNNIPVILDEETVGYVPSPRKRFVNNADIKSFARQQKWDLLRKKRVICGYNKIRKSPVKTVPARRKAASQKIAEDNNKNPKVKKPVQGVAQKKLTLIKQKKLTSLPQHPNPFAAKNMFYDERWIEKQGRGFTRWLNFILTPPDDMNTAEQTVKIDAGKLWIECNKESSCHVTAAPTKEYLSLKAYTARRRLNRLRRAACILFQSEPMVRVMSKLEAELEKGRIVVRKDRALHADFGIKQQILDMILCYNPLWLRVGLETIYGELLPIQSNNDVLGISKFIVRRLLNNPDISAEYAHPTVPHLYKPGYEVEVKKFTLKKFLLLIYFLDRAKLTRLIDHDPCLFCIDASFKSSRSLLLLFSRDFLSGEGDLTKHLSYLGYVVSHEQKPLEEFRYAVTNIAVDLRCGLRLMKVTSILVHSWFLMQQARVPAISKLQKIHNVGVALTCLTDHKVDIEQSISAKDICEGHREKTLSLLWQLIFKFQIEVLLNKKKLREEVSFLRRNLKIMKAINETKVPNPSGLVKCMGPASDLYGKSECLSLLLEWCQVVCLHYNIAVENFTVSFSDGRALCYIIHHYHPNVLPVENICNVTTQTYHPHDLNSTSNSDDSFHENWMHSYNSETNQSKIYETLLANERKNFQLIFDKLEELGGVPILTRSADMSNTIPDEKVVITLMSYLNVRLMSLSDEIRAVRIIQHAWRRYMIKKRKLQAKIEESAAVVLQKAVRKFLTICKQKKQVHAVTLIQATWRGYLVRKAIVKQTAAVACIMNWFRSYKQFQKSRHEFLQLRKAAVCLQRAQRTRIARKEFLETKKYVITIQSYVRMNQTRRHYLDLIESCIVVQRRWRSKILGRTIRMQYKQLRTSVVKVQSLIRRRLAVKEFKQRRNSTIVIQSWYRKCVARQMFLRKKSSVAVIESWYRSTKCMLEIKIKFDHLKKCALYLQSVYRGSVARQEYHRKVTAIVKIQSLVRGWRARSMATKKRKVIIKLQQAYKAKLIGRFEKMKYEKIKHSSIVLQAAWRRVLAERKVRRHGAARKIQAVVRSYIMWKRFVITKNAAIKIQSVFRMYLQKKHYDELVYATVVIQRAVRNRNVGRQQRMEYLQMKRNVVYLQSKIRSVLAQKQFRKVIWAVTVLQKNVRMFQQKKKYQLMRIASLIIQRQYRTFRISCQQRQAYLQVRSSIVYLQSKIRCTLERRKYVKILSAVIVLQKNVKMLLQRNEYRRIHSFTLIIQRRYRAYRIGRQELRNYHVKRGATISIQSWFKGWMVRHRYQKLRRACICIQTHVRRLRLERDYNRLKNAAVTVQRRYRATKLAMKTFEEYHKVRGAAIVIQSAVRCYLVNRTIKKWNRSATKIQSAYRCYKAKKDYRCAIAAATCIQKYYRLYVDGKKVRLCFIKRKMAAVKIQSIIRSHLSRKQFLKMRNSAIIIQSSYRCLVQKRCYKSKRDAALVIQTRWKATLLSRKERNKYLQLRRGVIKFQAQYRSRMQRRRYRNTMQKIIILQSVFRGFVIRGNYTKLKRAAEFLQCRWKAILYGREVRYSYLEARKRIVHCQALVRRFIALGKYRELIRATVVVQKNVRCKLAKIQYQKLRHSCLLIQMHWKAYKLCKIQRNRYLNVKSAAIRLQAVMKGYMLRKKLEHLHNQTVKIQSWYRCCKQRKRYLAMKEAAVKLQIFVRATLNAKTQREEYLNTRFRIVKCQAYVRMYLVKRDYEKKRTNLILIQSRYKGHSQRKAYLKLRSSTLLIQRCCRSYCRMKVQRQEFIQFRNSVIMCQAVVRRNIAMSNYYTQRRAIIKIQSVYKGWKQLERYKTVKKSASTIYSWWISVLMRNNEMQHYEHVRNSVVKIQAAVRGFIARLRYLKTRRTIVQVQAVFRGIKVRRRYLDQYQKICFIQRWFRRYLEMRRERRNYLLIKESSIIIQSNFRRYLACEKYEQDRMSVIKVQSLVRGWIARKESASRMKAVHTLQKHIKAHVKRLNEMDKYTKLRQASIVIQKNFRSIPARRLLEKHKAARVIQTAVRRFQARNKYVLIRSQIILVQSVIRAHAARKEAFRIREFSKAATTIQSHYRGYIERKRINQMKISRERQLRSFTSAVYFNTKAIIIQRAYRFAKARVVARNKLNAVITIQRWMKCCLLRLEYLKMKRGFMKLQIIIRRRQQYRKQCAIEIQSHVRSWLARQYFNKLKRAIVTIQSHWRGLQVRRSNKNKKIDKVRKKLNIVSVSAKEDMKLGSRTSSALDYLLQYKDIANILIALQHLDVVTRLSAVCCEKMVEGNAVEVIYKLIQSCNRSLPHMELIKYSVNVLLNLTKYEKTVESVWIVSGSVDTLLDLMSIFRDKGETIFTKCATLLWILVHNQQRAEAIQSMPRVTDKIRSLHFLVNRQSKIKEQRLTTKAKMEARNNINVSVASHSVRKLEKRKLKIQPDWVLGKGHMREFTSAQQSITSIMNVLGISKK